MAKQPGARTPTESVEQQCLFRWAAFAQAAHPELRLLCHIPNEGKRSKAAGARLKREGLKPGVPDLCLPVARGKYHGLYIELKRIGETASKEQEQWIADLRKQGYAAYVCQGWDSARRLIEDYLKLG